MAEESNFEVPSDNDTELMSSGEKSRQRDRACRDSPPSKYAKHEPEEEDAIDKLFVENAINQSKMGKINVAELRGRQQSDLEARELKTPLLRVLDSSKAFGLGNYDPERSFNNKLGKAKYVLKCEIIGEVPREFLVSLSKLAGAFLKQYPQIHAELTNDAKDLLHQKGIKNPSAGLVQAEVRELLFGRDCSNFWNKPAHELLLQRKITGKFGAQRIPDECISYDGSVNQEMLTKMAGWGMKLDPIPIINQDGKDPQNGLELLEKANANILPEGAEFEALS